MLSFKVLSLLCFSAVVTAADPAATYTGDHNVTDSKVLLRIGNGGAGQSGMVKALADAYINQKSDTTVTINYMQTGVVDVGITYSEIAERIAIDQGIATSPIYYAFRDHFIIVGPPSNPANLSKSSDTLIMFSNLRVAAEKGLAPGGTPVRFLSRYDKSATNIKDSFLWISIGQVPWATAYSTWYHQYIAFPIQALTAAILLGEYTLTDRGTWLSLPTNLTSQATIYKAATDDADDLLLNPAHLIVGKKAANPDTANDFAKWVIGDAGQKVITAFQKNGEQLYSGAPANRTL